MTNLTIVIPTLCVPTLKDPMSAAAVEGMKEMEEHVLVGNPLNESVCCLT